MYVDYQKIYTYTFEVIRYWFRVTELGIYVKGNEPMIHFIRGQVVPYSSSTWVCLGSMFSQVPLDKPCGIPAPLQSG